MTREQNSHCIAQMSAAVAALLVFIVNTSCGLVLATSAAQTATESIGPPALTAPRKLFAQAGARSSGDRSPGGGRRPGRVPSSPERRSHPASLLEGHSDVGARDALKRRIRLFDTKSKENTTSVHK